MASTVEVILKLTDKFSKEMKGVGKTTKGLKVDFKSLAKAGAGLTAGLAGVAMAGKAAFEFGKRGAVVEQTAESFALLIDKVGASKDLLEQLEVASKGTISKMGLMSSTATLLAGASGELAKELAKATPELLEIAKAANKLNPSLGSTTFMYESIAKGVKRASPLILDNLGIIIKADRAYSNLAKELGKTVEELNSAERSQAILNDTLVAGRVLIDQVGGSTDSAADSFARAETALANFKDELARRAAPAVSEFVTETLELIQAHQLLGKAQDFNLITQKDYDRAVIDVTLSTGKARDAIEEWLPLIEEQELAAEKVAEKFETLSFIMGMSVQMQDRSTTAWADWNISTERANEVAEDFSSTLEEVNARAAALIDESLARLTAPKQIALDLRVTDLNLTADLSGFIDKLLFQEAGGDDVARAAMQIKQAILQEKITTQEGREFLGELLVIDQQTLVDAGLQTAKEAATTIAEEFNISFGEATAMLGEAGEVEGLIKAVEAVTNIPEKLADRTQMLELAEGISLAGVNSGDAAPLIGDLADNATILASETAAASGKTNLLAAAIRALQSKEITVTTNFVTTGTPPPGFFGGGVGSGGGSPGTSPVPGGGRAAGGPVSAGGIFAVGERGPELFVPSTSGNIIPNNKIGGAGGGDTWNIEQNFWNQDVAALAYDEIWRMRDKRDNQFMGV